MGVLDTRGGRLAVLLIGVLAFTLVMLVDVLGTLFFAVTIAYVLLPAKRWIVRRGVPNRIGTGIATLSAFFATLVLFAPIVAVVYQRRELVVQYLLELPDEFVVLAFGFRYVLVVEAVVPIVQSVLTNVAIAIARAAPLLLTKLFLFTFVVYALLLRPEAVRDTVVRAVPASHRSDVRAFHERLRNTLYGIYVVQAATAVGTFLIALGVFFALGYETYFTFAVLAGILQFLPIVGPSLLILAIGGAEVLAGNTDGGVLTLVVGFVVVATLPDLVIRPRLAKYTADMAPSLYFIGFVAGALSFGAIGVVAGPVVVGLLVEAFEIASEHWGVSPSGVQ